MKFSVLSIFPGLIGDFCRYGLIQKALDRELIEVEAIDLRNFTNDRHRKVDDRPFGGGPGMVLMADPLFRAVEHIRSTREARVVLFSAAGRPLTQARAKRLAGRAEDLILVCGRYEGVDQRFVDGIVDDELSLGPYVLMGGEVPAMALIEAISRLLPGVIGDPGSLVTDTHYRRGQIGYPQYTHPREYRGWKVPEVLLSGDHRKIARWRARYSKIKKTDKKVICK